MENNLIFTKSVDKSVLKDGFTIPAYLHETIYESIGRRLAHGERTVIHVRIDKKEFELNLINQAFNQNRFEHHKDVLQVRYSINSDFTQTMRDMFASTYSYVLQNEGSVSSKKQLKIPVDIREQLLLYKSSEDGSYYIECLKIQDHVADIKDVVTEEAFELPADKWLDPKASIDVVNKLVKIRRIDQSISNNLKRLYNYCDQMTGECVGDKYGQSVVEAHHIEYFVNSQNNDASNIIILSPNFHRIVHRNKPIFDHTKKVFIFPNGVVEKVKLNKHL